jgi:threonine dehydratase
MIPPVRPIALSDIEAARERIKGTVLRTPLVKIDTGDGRDIRLKLENLQPTNAYKIRGGANSVAALSDEARSRGVWTISAGNAGQGVAYAARQYGVPCTIVAIETAAPYALSLREDGPQKFTAWEASFVDGAGGQSVTERMWQRMRPVTDGAITVTLKQTADAMRLIAEKSRTIAEGAGALSLAAALSDPSLEGPIVCVVSGGNIDLAKFAELVVG